MAPMAKDLSSMIITDIFWSASARALPMGDRRARRVITVRSVSTRTALAGTVMFLVEACPLPRSASMESSSQVNVSSPWGGSRTPEAICSMRLHCLRQAVASPDTSSISSRTPRT